jgi:hypothetical protein
VEPVLLDLGGELPQLLGGTDVLSLFGAAESLGGSARSATLRSTDPLRCASARALRIIVGM